MDLSGLTLREIALGMRKRSDGLRRVSRSACARYRQCEEDQARCSLRGSRADRVAVNARYYGRPREEWMADVWLAAKRVLRGIELLAWREVCVLGKANERRFDYRLVERVEEKFAAELVRCGIA